MIPGTSLAHYMANITNETVVGIQIKGDTEMRTATLEQRHTIISITALCTLLCLMFPCLSAAELQPMSETELKSIVLNDAAGPVNILVLKTEDVNSCRREPPRALTVTRAEAPVIIDAERLIEDLMAQYETMENGNGSVDGFYPILNDPSYLLKQ